MSPENRGKRIVRGLAVSIVLISFTTIEFYVVAKGTGKLPAQVIRFALTCWLCWSLVQGSKAARIIAIALLLPTGVYGLYFFTTNFSTQNVLFASAPAFYIFAALSLLFSPSVKAFFQSTERARELADPPPR